MEKKLDKRRPKDCSDLTDTDITNLAQLATNMSLPETARILKAFIRVRKSAKTGETGRVTRNCDVMTTAAALRKGWERRCEYGTPCCPFEYAMEAFYGEDPK